MSLAPDRTTPRTDAVEATVEQLRRETEPLSEVGLDPLVEQFGDRRFVLLGESTHGTAEYYRLRVRLTVRLLTEEDFDFVAVEGDWPACYAVNRYVKAAPDAGESAADVLDAFERWPTWMWANWEFVEFVEWLREFNAEYDADVGFYGLDVYSLFESMERVVEYLDDVDPGAVERARDAAQCFEPYGDDAREYARSTQLAPEDCADEVVELLAEVQQQEPRYAAAEESGPADDYFNAEQNALVVRNAESYYRSMVKGGSESWNVRDRHMLETLDRLADHYGPDARGIVWAHNTHVGDARATDMGDRGKVNLGQLVREDNDPDDVGIVGFGTHRGEVVAGDQWGAEMERMRLPEAREGSVGDAFHRAGVNGGLIDLESVGPDEPLAEGRGHRAAGVVYDPESELYNYVPTVLPERYDALVHLDETSAIHPLHIEPSGADPPEAYPWGL